MAWCGRSRTSPSDHFARDRAGRSGRRAGAGVDGAQHADVFSVAGAAGRIDRVAAHGNQAVAVLEHHPVGARGVRGMLHGLIPLRFTRFDENEIELRTRCLEELTLVGCGFSRSQRHVSGFTDIFSIAYQQILSIAKNWLKIMLFLNITFLYGSKFTWKFHKFFMFDLRSRT